MARIVAIDVGQKRTGIAVTDENQIVANPLTTVPSADVIKFLKNYLKNEPVGLFVVGEPKQMNNTVSEAWRFVKPFVAQLKKEFPAIPVEMADERFTSLLAQRAILESGKKKTDRRDKALIDAVSAAILLQGYLEAKTFKS